MNSPSMTISIASRCTPARSRVTTTPAAVSWMSARGTNARATATWTWPIPRTNPCMACSMRRWRADRSVAAILRIRIMSGFVLAGLLRRGDALHKPRLVPRRRVPVQHSLADGAVDGGDGLAQEAAGLGVLLRDQGPHPPDPGPELAPSRPVDGVAAPVLADILECRLDACHEVLLGLAPIRRRK